MTKYNKTIVNKICSLIKKDSYTIAEICSLVGISESTYHGWKDSNMEFLESIKKAREEFSGLMVVEAHKSLLKLIRGYSENEEKTVTIHRGKKSDEGDPVGVLKEHTVTTKHFQPNPTAIIFTLVNRDPENWKNRQNTEITGKDGKDLISDHVLTPEKRKLRIEVLKAKLNDGTIGT